MTEHRDNLYRKTKITNRIDDGRRTKIKEMKLQI